MDEAAVLAANALMNSRLDYCNPHLRSLSSFNMRKLQCMQNTLGGIVTNILMGYSYSQKKSIGCQLNFGIFSKLSLFYKFLHSGRQNCFSPRLSICCGRYGTRYNHPDKRFLKVPQYYPSRHKSKKHFGHSFAFGAPTLWNNLPDVVHSAPNLACFRKKLKSYLFDKAFPP